MTDRETEALIRLLDDPDKKTYSAVAKKILSVGEGMIPALELAWTQNESNKLLQKRIEKIVPALEHNAMTCKFKEWSLHPDSITHAAWLISRLQNFSLTEATFMEQIAQLKAHLYQYGFSNYSPLEHIKIMNYIFFRKMGFKPCRPDEFGNPNYCFPSCVMDNKTGNPETLAIIYMIMAQAAGLPIVGVNLPKNLILAYHDNDSGTRFYINPITNGAVFHRSEIDSFLETIGLEKQIQFYGPCTVSTMVIRALMRLEYSYRQKKQDSMADKVKEIISVIPCKLDDKIEWI